jgi:cytoskeletal protein CcmA (bactofilin family)
VFCGGLHLDGSVTGSVKPEGAGNTRLVVGEAGVIEGSCEAQVVELHGTVKGDITASQRVVLGPRARVEGNLSYGAIEMAAGATIKGKLLRL